MQLSRWSKFVQNLENFYFGDPATLLLDCQVPFSRLVTDVRWHGSVITVKRPEIRHLAADCKYLSYVRRVFTAIDTRNSQTANTDTLELVECSAADTVCLTHSRCGCSHPTTVGEARTRSSRAYGVYCGLHQLPADSLFVN